MRYMHLAPGDKDRGLEMLMQSREAGGVPVSLFAKACTPQGTTKPPAEGARAGNGSSRRRGEGS